MSINKEFSFKEKVGEGEELTEAFVINSGGKPLSLSLNSVSSSSTLAVLGIKQYQETSSEHEENKIQSPG